MRLKSCAMIKLIARNTINVAQLSAMLYDHILKYFTDAQITLKTNVPYWKYPEENVIIYNISNVRVITVSNLIATFPFAWEYKEGHSYNVNTQQTENFKDAIWSKNCQPEELFFMPEVEWVHIYTWEDREETVIN